MENILVSIRVRPLSKQEVAKGSPWKLTPDSITLPSGVSTSYQTHNFDKVFDPNTKTKAIYDTHTKKIISSAVKGFNGTIFAYGQTSSGKTYTMRGTPDEPGIIPLAIQDVFRNIELDQSREFLLRVSYMEIYNEEIKDLLAPENGKLQIHENNERGIFVAGLREEIVVNPEQVLPLMDFGEARRHVGETNMNVHSSRSHAIFRMVIESRDRSEDQEILQNSDPVRVSHLNLVDLAGSERLTKTGAEGARLKEGTHINKSLMTLGNVINKLSEGIEKQGGHVPYRDSKLTRILQPALGGNARTVIICNITPALVHVDETKGTLLFASRANRVTNCAQVNEIVTDAALLKRQKKEIAELREKLQNQESPVEQFEEEILNLRNELLKTELERERMALELQEFQKAQAERESRIKEQAQKIENLSTMVINSAVDDRDLEKRSRRNNRRVTWCARPESGIPPLPKLEGSCGKGVSKTPKTASYALPVQIDRGRSFGLPPPFEVLTEEDEDILLRGRNSSSLLGDHEQRIIDDDFMLPEVGPQSLVANRRRRSSNDVMVGNEDSDGRLAGLQSVELDETYSDRVKETSPQNVRICPRYHGMNLKGDTSVRQCNQSLPWSLVGKVDQLADQQESQVDESGRTTEPETKEESQSGVFKDCDIKHCYSAPVEQKSTMSVEERGILHSAVDSPPMQIEYASSDKDILLRRRAALRGELETLNTWLQMTDDDGKCLLEANRYLEELMPTDYQPGQSAKGSQFLELVSHERVAAQLVPVDEDLTSLTAELSILKGENIRLSACLASALVESERVATKHRTSLLRESSLLDETERLKLALQSVVDVRDKNMKASNEAAEELEKLETAVQKLAIQLAARFEKCDEHHETSQLLGEKAIDELTSVCECVETLLIAVKQASLEDGRSMLREPALSSSSQKLDEVQRLGKSLKVEIEGSTLNKRLEHVEEEKDDIGRWDPVVNRRGQSTVLGVDETKNQLNFLEHALQLKTDEVENLTYKLSQSHGNYAKLEFAMVEAESYSTEKLAELERAVATFKDEKEAAFLNFERLQNDVSAADRQYKDESMELERLSNQLEALADNMQQREEERTAAIALVTAVTKEKEDIVEELLDAHISVQSLKAELTAQAQDNSEKCSRFNQDIILLRDELQKWKKLQEETSHSNKLLEKKLQQVLQGNTQMSLTHDKLLKDLEGDMESLKEQFRELEQQIEGAQQQGHDLRMSQSKQLEQLRLELQDWKFHLSTSRDEVQMLSKENRTLLVANTKQQFALDATSGRLEIFENRLEEADLELAGFKSLLQKAGFETVDIWNLESLWQFETRLKAQNNEAKRLQAALASKKIEIIDLEVQVESAKSQCQKYEEEIQYLKTRVLTPEQETGVREIVHQNKRLQALLKKADEKEQKQHDLVKGKEFSLRALQTTIGSLNAQIANLQKDLAASKDELESVCQLRKIALPAGPLGKSSTSSCKPTRSAKFPLWSTLQSSTSLPSNLFQNSDGPAAMAESTCTESSGLGYCMPLSEKSSNESPCLTERKKARLFPVSERSQLSRSLGLTHPFVLSQSHSDVDQNKENFKRH